MKFVADENFPREALHRLREFGFDVASVAETNPGLPDSGVLALASDEVRTLLTFDKDFGYLAFREGLPASCGVILFRTGSRDPGESAALALATLQAGVAWAGHFCVVNDRKIRVTPLPPRPGRA